MQIGGALRSGKPHDGRAPDYDDWALNGDLLFWNHTLQRSYEVSSMGIRVNAESMDRQLSLAGCDARRTLPFHKALLSGELPDTMGGGIGQSRLCMLLLGSAHIGEVQSSIWEGAEPFGKMDEKTRKTMFSAFSAFLRNSGALLPKTLLTNGKTNDIVTVLTQIIH